MAVSLPASIELPEPGRPVAPTHLGEHLYILLERRAAHQTHPSSPALASPVTAVTVTDSWLSRQKSRRVVTQSPLCCHRYRCSRPLLRPLRVAVSTVLRGSAPWHCAPRPPTPSCHWLLLPAAAAGGGPAPGSWRPEAGGCVTWINAR